MKKSVLLVLFITIIAIVIVSNLNSTVANASSPPNATAGAPADNGGQTCTNCHGGTATQTTGIISSNIPASGFVGGTTYSVSVTMSGASAYGFELTPQTATSNVGIGSWIAGTGSSVSTKYIKHSGKKTGASAVWTFSWTAPTTATTVTFYGAFNYANNNSTSSGDVIRKSSITYFANTTGIVDHKTLSTLVSVFPNPATEVLHITSTEVFDKGSIYSIEGKLVKTISEEELSSKIITVSSLDNGFYYLNIYTNDKPIVTKFFKN